MTKLILNLADMLAIGSLVVAYILAAIGAGLGLLRLAGVRNDLAQTPIVTAAAALSLGHGVLGLLWQTMAVFHLFGALLQSLVLLAMAGLLLALWRPMLAPASIRGAMRATDSDRIAARMFGVASAVMIAFAAPLSLMPPGTDALAFYMAQPKLIAATGSLLPFPGYAAFAQVGLQSEMHYAVLFAFGGNYLGMHAGKIFVMIAGLAMLPLIWGCCARAGMQPVAGWMSLMIVQASTAFSLLLSDGKTDLLPTALAVLSFYLLLSRSWSRGDVLLSGAAAGLAMTSKLSFIPTLGTSILLLMLGLLWLRGKSQRGIVKQTLLHSLCFAAGAVVPLLLLSLKNAVVFNEPLAPFLMLHGTKSFDINQVWYSPENTRWIVSTYPLALIFGQYPMQHGNVSVLTLAVLPLLFARSLARGVPRNTILLAIAGLAGTVVWLVLRPSVLAPRYLLPSLIALAPFTGFLLGQLWYHGKKIDRFGLGIITGTLVMLAVSDARMDWRNATPITRATAHPIWRVAEAANGASEVTPRVLNLTVYSAMFDSKLLRCMLKVDRVIELSRDMAAFWAFVNEQGVTHITYDRLTHEAQLLSPLDPSKAPAWLEVEETVIDGRFRSYHVKPKPGAPPPTETCDATD